MKTYLYAMIFAFLLCLGFASSADAQTNPSGQTTNAGDNNRDTRSDYNYLGLLGLLGLYGLHKVRVSSGTYADRKTI